MQLHHLALALSFGLAACTPATAPPEPPSPPPTAPAPIATLTPPHTPSPTRDPVARATGLAATQAVLAARTIERAQATWTAAVVEYQTQVATWATEIATQTPPDRVAALTSPDGRHRLEHWRTDCAEVSHPDSQPVMAAHEQLILTDTDGGQPQVVETQVRLCEGLGAFGLAPVRWSSDSRFVYFSTAALNSPDGAPCYWARPLVRLDVTSGARARTVEGVPAPDGGLIASLLMDRIHLWRWDQEATTVIDVGEPVYEIARLAWSADSTRLALLGFGPDGCWGARAPWLIVVDAAQGVITHRQDLGEVAWGDVALARAAWWAVTLEWSDADTLRLLQIEGDDQQRYSLTARLRASGMEISAP